jgi:hypothetical protein
LSDPIRPEPALLAAFLRGFFGYGNPAAPLWFVGMEEGCEARDELGIRAESVRRMMAWEARGRRVVDDLRGYHEHIGVIRHFNADAPLQATWRGLMRVRSEALGQEPGADDLRQHQISGWGGQGGDCCLLELFPLAKPKRASWPFGAWALHFPDLESDIAYRRNLAPRREQELSRLIEEHRPVAVVFYGAEHKAHWDAIACASFQPLAGTNRPFDRAERDETTFYRMWHPQYLSNADLKTLGGDIRRLQRWKP